MGVDSDSSGEASSGPDDGEFGHVDAFSDIIGLNDGVRADH
jgi:hypothetical protein